jgi:hypothetical protein
VVFVVFSLGKLACFEKTILLEKEKIGLFAEKQTKTLLEETFGKLLREKNLNLK